MSEEIHPSTRHQGQALPGNTKPLADPLAANQFLAQVASAQTRAQAQSTADRLIQAVEQPGIAYAEAIAENLSAAERRRLDQPLARLREAQLKREHSEVVSQLYRIATLSGLPADGNVHDYFADKVLRDATVIGDHLDVRDANYYGYRELAKVMGNSLLLHATEGRGEGSPLYRPLKSQLNQLLEMERGYRLNLRAEASAMQLMTARFEALGQNGPALLQHVEGLNDPATRAQRKQVAEFRQAMNMISDPEAGQAWANAAFAKTPPEQFMLGLVASFIPGYQDLAQGTTRLVTDPGRVLQEVGHGLGQAGQALLHDPRGLLAAIHDAGERQSGGSSAYARGLMTGLLMDAAITVAGAGAGTSKIMGWARSKHAARSLGNMGEDLLRIARTSDKLSPDELAKVQNIIGKVRKIEQNHPVGDWVNSNSRLQRLYDDVRGFAHKPGRPPADRGLGTLARQSAGAAPSSSHPSRPSPASRSPGHADFTSPHGNGSLTLRPLKQDAPEHAVEGVQGNSRLEAMLQALNPEASSTNCFQCAVVVAESFRNDQRLPVDGGTLPIPSPGTAVISLEKAYGKEFETFQAEQIAKVVEEVEGLPNGGGGIIYAWFKSGGFHAFNVFNDQGIAYLLDGQKGRVLALDSKETSPGTLWNFMHEQFEDRGILQLTLSPEAFVKQAGEEIDELGFMRTDNAVFSPGSAHPRPHWWPERSHGGAGEMGFELPARPTGLSGNGGRGENRFFENRDVYHPDVDQFNDALREWAAITEREINAGSGGLAEILAQIEPLAQQLGGDVFANTPVAATYGVERISGRRSTEVTNPRFDRYLEPTLDFIERDWGNVILASTGEKPSFPATELRERLANSDPKALDLIHVSSMQVGDASALTSMMIFSAPAASGAYPYTLTTLYPARPESMGEVKALLSQKWDAMQDGASNGGNIRELAADFMYDYSRLYWHIHGDQDIGTALMVGFMDAFGDSPPKLKPGVDLSAESMQRTRQDYIRDFSDGVFFIE